MSHFQLRWLAPALVWACVCCNIYAVDGIVLIDQNRALAGGVTPGDTPGFPVTISLTGSYRLSGNLTVPNENTTAILITADNVTIDLNGFSIIGPTVCTGGPPVTSCSPSGAGAGVVGGNHFSITVVNGSVRGMGSMGINLGNTTGSHVEKVHADSNGATGILVRFGIVSGNTAFGNGVNGIFADSGSTVVSNTAYANGNRGISVVCPGSVVGNTTVANTTDLFTFGAGCAIANNAP
jgi:hypothetical protein